MEYLALPEEIWLRIDQMKKAREQARLEYDKLSQRYDKLAQTGQVYDKMAHIQEKMIDRYYCELPQTRDKPILSHCPKFLKSIIMPVIQLLTRFIQSYSNKRR